MSSSAFFIEAAANTMRDFSCAAAGEWAAPSRVMKAAKIPASRRIVALQACSRARFHARKSGGGWVGMRQAEAPFRQPDGLTVDRDIAGENNISLTGRVKPAGAVRPLKHDPEKWAP